MQATTSFRLLPVLVWLVVAFGCAQPPERPDRATDPDAVRAAELATAGQHLAAAELYRSLAARSALPERRADYLLAAADAARNGGDWDAARAALAELDGMDLAGLPALRRRLLGAEILLQDRQPAEAVTLLGTLPAAPVPRELAIRFHRDRAAAYRQMGNLLETAHALQAVDALQEDPLERLQTQTDILRTLALLNELVLTNLQPSPPGIAGGWMQLALLVKEHGSAPDRLAPELGAWRARFPDHPALPELLDHYRWQMQSQLQRASRIAVLLPQSGTFAEAAAAIRDGILIEHFRQEPAQRPELRFYDATDPAGTWPLYTRAVADGAELVLGPLQKDGVAQLLRAGELPVPVLALNQVEIEAAPPTNLFMYSLSPEDEARQVAERGWIDGHRRPVILAPRGDWGARVARAFEERWRALGGSVAGTAYYDDSSHDYSETITGLLHLDRSHARHNELQRWLGRRVEFEPRRRDDVDMVFMAAQPVQAQGIRPQLQFHHAADIPVYATSHAWTGALAPQQVADMKGIMLADIPWLVADDNALRESVGSLLPKSRSAYARLYAMGIDAMRLVPHLKRLGSSRYESLDGTTGNLYMDETHQIHRQLVWVRLDESPEILGFAPRLDLQGSELALPTPVLGNATSTP